MSQSPSRFDVSSVNGVQQCDLTSPFLSLVCRSFVFSHSPAKVSSGLTDVSSLAVAAFDLYTAPCLSSGCL